jgi:sugar/nucleoside kinase (ribokinase family)
MNLSPSKKTLVVGSSVIDVILRVPSLPARGEDANIVWSQYRLGGCAYNVFKALKKAAPELPAELCSPVGGGVYGKMVREKLAEEGTAPFVELEEDNGCCYCIVEENGERTFLSHHGAEYRFSRDWFGKPWRDSFDFSECDSVYISGIDIEDPTGGEIIAFVCEHPELEVFFSPGPRFERIPQEKRETLMNRSPVLHINEDEAYAFTANDPVFFYFLAKSDARPRQSVETSAEYLAARTGNAVVVTLGDKGCYYFNPEGETKSGFVPAFPAAVSDTVGAGDAHCGALIASLKKGLNWHDACEVANRIAADAVSGK